MGCELRKDGAVGLLTLKGKLALGVAVEEFRNAWGEALAAGCRNLVINLAEVPMVDSSGIGTLIRCHSAVVATKGKMRLVAPTQVVRHALEISRLDSIFQFFDDEASALASLPPAGTATSAS